MKRYIILPVVLACFIFSCSSPESKKPKEPKPVVAEKKINTDSIRSILLKIGHADQYYRLLLDSLEQVHGWDSPEIQNTYVTMHKIDSVNLGFVDRIIKKFGWPGKSMVGEDASVAAWLVIQHSGDVQTMRKYMPLMKEAAEEGELDWDMFALYVDRVKMLSNENQIYGSQIIYNEAKKRMELYPVEDIKNVDNRRESVGLGPLKDYLTIMNVQFDPDTLGF